MRFSRSTHLLVFFSLETLTSIIRGLAYLTQMVNFPTRIPDCDSHSLALLDFFLSSDGNICSAVASPPLGNSDHVAVSISIDFPPNSQPDASFHCLAYDYSRADSDGLRHHLGDVPWEESSSRCFCCCY